jgi:hypothetical protein
MKPLLSLAVILLTVLVGMTGYRLFARTDQWTYLVAAPKDEELVHTLNELGSQGWEIVSSRRATNGEGGVASYEMVLRHKGVGVHYDGKP